MNNNLRVISFHNNIKPFSVKNNAEIVKMCLKQGSTLNVDVIVFPKNTLYGKGLNNFKYNNSIINEISGCFFDIIEYSKGINSYIVIDSFKVKGNVVINGTFLIYKGEEILFIKSNSFKTCTINGICTTIINCEFKDSVDFLSKANAVGSKFCILSQYEAFDVTTFNKTLSIIKAISLNYSMAITYNSGSICDSSGIYNYKGFSFNVEDGYVVSKNCVQSNHLKSNAIYSVCDYDFDFLTYDIDNNNYGDDIKHLTIINKKNELLRKFTINPFSEYYGSYDNKFILSIFDMQVEALAKRIKNTKITNLVLPVSGGLDSTMAFLVCIKALDVLKLKRSNLKAVTLPGLGTTGKTYENACKLIKCQGAEFLEVSIVNAVLNHFMDIKHDEKNKDVVFENSQARERTQIALDLANKYNAICVGTGDLSEDALGFCTFGGDHLSLFNVNTCLTKTLIRQVIKMLINLNLFVDSNDILEDVLNTPVSPELLPPQNGEIVQKTENILGDYILHDFFLFYLLKYNLSFEKIYIYAVNAFKGKYENEYIKEKLILFLNRFFKNQFKRNCQPESVAITDINLIEDKFMFSSDVNMADIIDKLKDL